MVRRAGCLAAAIAMVAAAPAAAETRALLDAPRADDVAISGSEVVVGRVLGRRGVAVDAVPVSGGPARRVLTVPAPRGRRAVSVDLAASPERVAAIVGFEDAEGNPRDRFVFAGPPAGPLALVRRLHELRERSWIPLAVSADAARVLLAEVRFYPLSHRVRVLGEHAFPWAGGLTAPVVLAGDRVAFLGSPRSPRLDRIVVADRRSGAAEFWVPRLGADVDFDDLDLAADGRVAFSADGRLVTAAPGVAARTIAGTFAFPRFAGPRIVAAEETRFRAKQPVALEPRLQLGPPSSRLDAVDASEVGTAWLANGCVLFSDLAGSAVTQPPAGPCPRAEAHIHGGPQRLRDGRIRVVVTCVAAPDGVCRGTAMLREAFVLGRGAFAVPAGTRRRIPVSLTRRGLRAVRRELRLAGSTMPAVTGRLRGGRLANTGHEGVYIRR